MLAFSSSVGGRGLAASALALLFLVGQLASFGHRLWVQHEVCLEHGESIHVEAVASAEAGAARELRPSSHAEAAHGHEHCLVWLPRQDSLPRLATSDLSFTPTAHRVDRLTGTVSLRASIELLRLAPKASPPAQL